MKINKLILFAALLSLFTFSYAQAEEEAEELPPQPKIHADSIEKNPLQGAAVSLNTEDDVVIQGVFYEPEEKDEATRYFILLHDLGKNKSSFYHFTKALKTENMGFLAIDLRGHGQSAELKHYSSFQKKGIDNEFNLMIKDVNAAVEYLKKKDIDPQNIFIAGAGLGANVAAKSALFNSDIGGIALLTPGSNNRDVLAIPGVRVWKGPLFIGVASNIKKPFFEASIIRNNAYTYTGARNVIFATAYDKEGTEMLDRYLTPALIQWARTPVRPEVKPDPEIFMEEAPEEFYGTGDYIAVF